MPGDTPATSEFYSFQPAECTAFCLFLILFFKPTMFSETTQWRNPLVSDFSFFSPKATYLTQTAEEKYFSSFLHQYFHLQQVVLLSKALPTLLVRKEPLKSRKTVLFPQDMDFGLGLQVMIELTQYTVLFTCKTTKILTCAQDTLQSCSQKIYIL